MLSQLVCTSQGMLIGYCGNQTHPIDEILVFDYGIVVVPFDEGLTEDPVKSEGKIEEKEEEKSGKLERLKSEKLRRLKSGKLRRLRSEPVEIA